MPPTGSARGRRADWLQQLATALVLLPTAILAVATVSLFMGLRLGAWLLPAGAAATTVALPVLLGTSWRRVAGIAAVAGVAHVAAGVATVLLPDGSWDGLAYHQEGVLRLAAGWNPVYEAADAYGRGAEIYLNHYPKGTWIAAVSVFLSSGHVEAGKLFNLTLMAAAAAQVTSAALRLTALPALAAVLIGVLAAFNPVALYQAATFYVDGLLGNVLAVLGASLAVYAATASRGALTLLILATALAVNVKFTGVVYAAVLILFTIPLVWAWQGARPAMRLTAAGALAAVVGVGVLGYAPYVRNVRARGEPFYPASPPPAHRPDSLALQRPANLTDQDRFTRFLVSSFSRSEPVRPPAATRLKPPFTIGSSERRGVYGADIESGGFGPLYGAMLLLAGVGAVALLLAPADRTAGGVALFGSGVLLGSVFVHAETWWARFVPQAWLVPLLIGGACLLAPARSLRWTIGCLLVVVAVVDVAIVQANVGWRAVRYARETRASLKEMAAAGRVMVYLTPFASVRQRLHEAGVEFEVADGPPPPSHATHRIPTPGGVAFWFPIR